MIRPAGAALLALLLLPPVTGARWQAPVDAPVVRGFTYDRGAPFAAGQRRGMDFAARRGAAVRAACGGVVTFAGRVPGGALGVSVRCGRLSATHVGLGALRVRAGAAVARGALLGRAGAAGVIRLGARRAGDRLGYVDPARLLGADPPALGPAPAGRRPAPPPRPRATPVRPPRPAPAPAPSLPPVAWAGAALVAAGTGVGRLVRRRRRDGRAAARGAAAVRR